LEGLIATLKHPAVQAAAIVIGLAGLACELLAIRALAVLKPKTWADLPKHIPVMLYAGGTAFALAVVAFALAHPSS
jgi:hypothetical protein